MSLLHALLLTISIISSRTNRLATAYTLANKRVLVTGSSGGIGAGIAKLLAQEGARIVIHYNTRYEGALLTKQSIEANGGICDGIIQCDFSDPKNIREMFSFVDQTWNRGIDVLVNNAGVITKLAVEDDDEDCSTWMETMQINVNAPYQLSRLAYQRMKHQVEGGVIINVSSIHGSTSVEWMTAYAASKAALDRLTAGLANEWAPDRIRVNAVAPGVVPVERTAAVFSKKEAQDLWLPHIPAQRLGTVEEIAHAVVYLCENEWSTGTILTIDGGATSRANMPIRPKPEVPARIEKVYDQKANGKVASCES